MSTNADPITRVKSVAASPTLTPPSLKILPAAIAKVLTTMPMPKILAAMTLRARPASSSVSHTSAMMLSIVWAWAMGLALLHPATPAPTRRPLRMAHPWALVCLIPLTDLKAATVMRISITNILIIRAMARLNRQIASLPYGISMTPVDHLTKGLVLPRPATRQ